MTIRAPDPVIQPEHVEMLLRAAGLAPSLHNSQPWQFAVGASHVEVYADPSKQLRDSDPSGRSLLISCGAAVFNLRVAFARLGYGPRPRLVPDEADPTLVATVDVDKRQRGHRSGPVLRSSARPQNQQAPIPGPQPAAFAVRHSE